MCFSTESALLWVPTVLLFSPTCSTIRMKQTTHEHEKEEFKFTFRNMNIVISRNNSKLIDVEIKDITDRSTSYIGLHLEFNSWAGTAYHSGAHELTDSFLCSVLSIIDFPFVFWPFYCLYSFELRPLTTSIGISRLFLWFY